MLARGPSAAGGSGPGELRLDDGAEHDEEVVGAVAERLALRAHPHGAGALRPRQRRAAERGGEVGTWPSPMR